MRFQYLVVFAFCAWMSQAAAQETMPTCFTSSETNSIIAKGIDWQGEIPVPGPIADLRTQFSPSPEGYYLWIEQAISSDYYKGLPYSQMSDALDYLEQQNRSQDYDPDALAHVIHVCNRTGKDVYTVPVPARKGVLVTNASFPTTHTIRMTFDPRQGPYHKSLIANISSKQVFSVDTNNDLGVFVLDAGVVSPDEKWVIQRVGFRGTTLVYANGKMILPYQMPLDSSDSPSQYEADLKKVEDRLKSDSTFYSASDVIPQSFYSGDNRYMTLWWKSAPVSDDDQEKFEKLGVGKFFWSWDTPNPDPPDPSLNATSQLAIIDLDKASKGDAKLDEYMKVVSVEDQSEKYNEFSSQHAHLIPLVDMDGRVYLAVNPRDLDPTRQNLANDPAERFYVCDIQGNPITPTGDKR